MNAYQQLKSRQQARVDAFPLGAAFSDKQFTEMMTNRFGLQDTPEDRQKIISLGYGVFIRKSDKEAYVALMNSINKELEEFLEDDANFIAACEYEYANHECQISDDWEVGLRALGLSYDTITDRQLKLAKQARDNFWRRCCENGWF